ncbi:MAG: hypothetical protein EP336_15260 [Rhodobacteraceae bacterium]|nr:MAG: hypothetical protein EP336_15260 [Paracoccaceae bacterium]
MNMRAAKRSRLSIAASSGFCEAIKARGHECGQIVAKPGQLACFCRCEGKARGNTLQRSDAADVSAPLDPAMCSPHKKTDPFAERALMSDNGLTGRNAPVAAMAKRNLRNRLVRLRYASPDSYPVTALLPERARQAAMSRVCYAPAQKLFYARLPKCANSTIVRTMANASRPGLEDVRINRLKALFNTLPWPREFEAAAKITVLRDPVERAVSAWRDKGHSAAFIRQHRYAGDEETIPTLEQFLIALRDNDYYRNGHYLPQLDMIPGPIERYDVGTVERLEPFLERVCMTYFGQFSGLQNVLHHATDSRKKKLEISVRERALIEALYARDIAFYQSLRG